MPARRLTPKTILREEEVAAVSRRVGGLFGPEVAAMAAEHGVNIGNIVRFGSVAKRLEEARGSLGLSVKDVALQLKTPQHRIRDFERSRVSAGDELLVRNYATLLGIHAWYARWYRQNKVVFAATAEGDA